MLKHKCEIQFENLFQVFYTRSTSPVQTWIMNRVFYYPIWSRHICIIILWYMFYISVASILLFCHMLDKKKLYALNLIFKLFSNKLYFKGFFFSNNRYLKLQVCFVWWNKKCIYEIFRCEVSGNCNAHRGIKYYFWT